MRRIGILTVSLAAAGLLAGCSSGYSSSSSAPSSSAGSGSPAAVVLSTWASPVGQIVVTGQGRAVYVFDDDTPGSGASACTGSCASLWPAVTTTGTAAPVSGVTGSIGTLHRADGSTQVTLDGHPLYTYSGDPGSGQINGQGFMNLWWVVSPSGTKVTATASSSSAPAQGPSY